MTPLFDANLNRNLLFEKVILFDRSVLFDAINAQEQKITQFYRKQWKNYLKTKNTVDEN